MSAALRLAPVNLTRLIEHILIGLEPAATNETSRGRYSVSRTATFSPNRCLTATSIVLNGTPSPWDLTTAIPSECLHTGATTVRGLVGLEWVYLLLRRMGERAGVPNLHTHRFRHSYAMNALRAGMPEHVPCGRRAGSGSRPGGRATVPPTGVAGGSAGQAALGPWRRKLLKSPLPAQVLAGQLEK